MDFYPSNDDIRDVDAARQWLRSMLQMFLQPIVKSTLKRAAIGQCLVRAARPYSVIAPLLFGLGVELDHIFESKWLINKRFRLGYSISYDEVTRFKQNSIVSSNFEDVLLKYPGSVTQWVANNVDHKPQHVRTRLQDYIPWYVKNKSFCTIRKATTYFSEFTNPA